MLKRNEVYLEGYGGPMGLVYFMDDQGHLGFGKLCTFIITLIPFLFLLNMNRLMMNLTICLFIVEEAWNFLIVYDIYMFIHLPSHYEGIVWTPSSPLQHQIYSEGLPSHQESFFMLLGYLVYMMMIIPTIYSFIVQLSLRTRSGCSDNDHTEPFLMA